ncbi:MULTISPECIES: enoyl-CoA hydratase/isomerase family protein [Paraburkholderia]|uniref:3-hydroxyisobutyryl-CoA hydrolase n=1 Tax=Paraburkholderia madseniana TaxID=2599607 RepID=A0AAP5BJS3_9BURK|nr:MULTISPECIES: enoyl-CoA hydratase/isomerase family protein [Paraburkholderia]MCX4149972.1 enoyl-CoA hydratase/isomerase family protein [Paraburkholderia madseniana]MDN7152908.1 enoyl-CoA hydratase/isomerase family protein [Paraburkholderia sp. WS6]MDQ6411790.1 enoyl-CoA hydratase/isomerase family protein [Paraburkholderia madseniana]
MMDSQVNFSTLHTASGRVFKLATLNVPSRLNPLSLEMIDLLAPQLAAWAQDEQVVGVILNASGEKAFCAGGDVLDLYRSIRSTRSGEVPVRAASFFEREYRLNHHIHRYPKPILCWGHGAVMGGGIGLMVGASHRVVTPTSRLAMPEIRIGLFPDVGGSWFLPRLPGKAGLFLALTGAQLNSSDACFLGMADYALPEGRLSTVLDQIVAEAWQGEPESDSARLSHLLEKYVEIDMPQSTMALHLARIDKVIGRDTISDIAPRLAALARDEDACLAQAGVNFVKGSPTSAVVAFEMQRRCRHLSLGEVFQLEYQAAVGCATHPDLVEGIRALLVDKDRHPRWQASSLDEVTFDQIEAQLAPRFRGQHPLADLT